MSVLTVDDYSSKLSNIPIYASRPGHSGSGLGNAKERLFGVEENNDGGADFNGDEFKVQEEHASSEVSLKTFNAKKNEVTGTNNGRTMRFLVERLAVFDDTPHTFNLRGKTHHVAGRSKFYHSMYFGKARPCGNVSLSLDRMSDGHIHLVEDERTSLISYDPSALTTPFTKKLNRLIFTLGSANPLDPKHPAYQSLVTNGIPREGKFSSVTIYEGFSMDLFWKAFFDGYLSWNVRGWHADIGGKNLYVRDHGMAWRIHRNHLHMLYEQPPITREIN